MIETVAIEPAARALLDAQALRCAESAADWAQRHAAAHRVAFEGAHIWHWRSLEDSSVEEAVLELAVRGDPDDALAFSGAVSTYLGELTERSPSPAADRLAVSVRWR